MKKHPENTPKIDQKTMFQPPGPVQIDPEQSICRGKKIISQKAPRNDSFKPFLIFQQFFSKIDEDFWPFCYLQPICCVSVCPQGPFFYKKSHFWRTSVIYLFKKLKKPNFFAKKLHIFLFPRFTIERPVYKAIAMQGKKSLSWKFLRDSTRFLELKI